MRSDDRLPMGRRRWPRRLAIAAGVLTALTLTAWAVAESAWTNERIRRALLGRAADALAADLEIQRVEGSVFGQLKLVGVELTLGGEPVITAESIVVTYRPLTMIRDGLVIDDVAVMAPHVVAAEDGDGWNVTRLLRPQPDNSSGRPTFRIGRLAVLGGDAIIRFRNGRTQRVSDINLAVRLAAADVLTIDVERLRASDPAADFRILDTTGSVIIGPDDISVHDARLTTSAGRVTGRVSVARGQPHSMAFKVRADSVSASVVRSYVPTLQMLPTSATIAVSGEGTTQAFTADWTVDSPEGRLTGSTRGSSEGDVQRLAGDARIVGMRPAAWFPALVDLQPLDVVATYDARIPEAATETVVTFDAAAPRILYADHAASSVRAQGTARRGVIDAAITADAYGAAIAGDARIDTKAERLVADGRFENADLRRLPRHLEVPPLESRLTGAFTLSVNLQGAARDWKVSTVLDESTIAGATIGSGATLRAQSAGGELTYGADANLRGLDPASLAPVAPERAGLLRRWSGALNANMQFDAAGASLDSMRGTLTAQVTDSHLPGVDLTNVVLTASLRERSLEATASGRAAVDATRLPRAPEMQARQLSGSIVLEARVTVPDISHQPPIEDITASARITRDPATPDAASSHLDVDAALAGGVLTLNVFDINLPSATATAAGALALAGEGTSDLRVTVNVSELSSLREWLPRPVAGRATLSARVTGSSEHQHASGELRVFGLESGAIGAVTFGGTFAADTVRFDTARATGQIEFSSAFVNIGDMRFDRVTGVVGYDPAEIATRATFADTARSLEVSARVRPLEGFHDAVIDRLMVRSGETTWTMPDGVTAGVRYGNQTLAIADLTLAGQHGQLAVEGDLGAEASRPLRIEAREIGLAALKDWLPATHSIAGRLDGTATVTGTLDNPIVVAEATVNSGSVNGMPFRLLDANGTYADHRATIDAVLDATEGSSLTVAGTVPISAKSEPIPWDLSIRSSGINLVYLQPVVTAVESISGTGRFDLRVTGTAPDFDGEVALTNVAFRVPATGVSYRNVSADLSASGQELTIREFRAEDGDGHPLRIQGAFNLPGLTLPENFDLHVTASDFSVLDNELGRMALSTELQVMGDLQTPLVAGTLKVDRGRLELDRLMQRLSSAYAPVEEPAPAAGDTGTPFSRSSLSITLDMPDNIVLRGRDLRTRGGGLLGLGDINATVGGALSIAKEVNEPLEVLGRMNVVRGDYRFQGRPFRIVRGSSVRFAGDPSQPLLDVEAERTISGVVATVRVTGGPDRPVVNLSSQPPLDPGDILSLIVFNQSMNRLPAGQRVSLAARAGALAAGAIATPIADSVARALDLDQFDIRPSDTGLGSSLLVGRQVTERLFVGFRQEFGDADASQVTFEYRLNEFLRIVTSFAQGRGTAEIGQRAETAGLDLFFVIR